MATTLMAVVIVSPLAWYFMDHWLQKYTYHKAFSWWFFVAAINSNRC